MNLVPFRALLIFPGLLYAVPMAWNGWCLRV